MQRDGEETIASGDLYVHRPPNPDPAAGIPIFAIGAHRYYLRVTQILAGDAEARRFTFAFELLRSRTWSVVGTFKARVQWIESAGDVLRGKVRNAHGADVGSLTLTWVSPYLRRAVVEIDGVPECELPLHRADGLAWRDIFDPVGWDLTVVESDADVAEPSGESWSNAELHATLTARRERVDLDREWRYWLGCVRLLDAHGADRGIMFDQSGDVPREGAAIAAHWMVPDEQLWGTIRGARFGTTDQYFRTAVHEIGHAMGLVHNNLELGIMMPTDGLAEHASEHAPERFPENTNWSFSTDDQKRLRHWPDPLVRPGGLRWRAGDNAPVLPHPDLPVVPAGVVLTVTPLLTRVPLGAPVRVDLALANDEAMRIPTDLSLAAGFVSGTVTGPTGAARSFRSLIQCIDEEQLLVATEAEGSITLLHGDGGALFGIAGAHTVRVDVQWPVGGVNFRVSGDCTVTVTAAVDDAHREAAGRLLATPDTLLTLAFGGDHLPAGQEAIAAALDNDVLRPHYAYIEAKRIAQPFFGRSAETERATALIGDDAVMSTAEAAKAARFTRPG